MMEKMLKVGILSSTHGVHGEMKVFPTTDDVRRFKKLKEVLLEKGSEYLPLEIEGVKFFKQFVIIKFKGYDSINDIEKYKGMSLFVTRENAVPLKKDEYFMADLIGLKVEDDAGQALGELTDVLQTGANDVYVIRCEEGGELLLPAIKQCILDVDVEDGVMKVHVLEGL
jgi:16S rRNA processing protein RimM